MTEREGQPLPDWAEAERTGDLGWIRDNLHTFWPMAQQGYDRVGRGSVVVDTTITITHPQGMGHPVGYFPAEALDQLGDAHTQRLIRQYEPATEFITSLLKPENRLSSYRLRVIGEPREDLGDRLQESPAPQPSEEEIPLAASDLEMPDLATLMAWEEEGGCEAACPYGCWLEPDGTCEHGPPSWLIVLGLI